MILSSKNFTLTNKRFDELFELEILKFHKKEGQIIIIFPVNMKFPESFGMSNYFIDRIIVHPNKKIYIKSEIFVRDYSKKNTDKNYIEMGPFKISRCKYEYIKLLSS
jgi:hypothetical protein